MKEGNKIQDKKSALARLSNSNAEAKITGNIVGPKSPEKEIEQIEKISKSSEVDIISAAEIKADDSVRTKKKPMKRKSTEEKILMSVTIAPELHLKLKLLSAYDGKSMSGTIEELLRKHFKTNREIREKLKDLFE